MAPAPAAPAVRHDRAEPKTKDVERFLKFVRSGGPGPHSYVVLLGLDTFDASELLRAVKKGLAYRTFERFRRNTSLSAESVMLLVNIPRRTLTRRKREGRFLPDESDRLLRASRLFAKALELFEGNADAASEWLASSQPALGGATPLELAKTEIGTIEIERLIGRLEHGVFT